MTKIASLLLSLIIAGAANADDAPPIAGDWTINYELTDELAPEFKDANLFSGMTNGRVGVSVMGIPIPGTGQKPSPRPSNARDPEVLSCNDMRIELLGKEMHMTYVGVGGEVFKQGDFRGRKTSWTGRTIKQRYKTTSRSVKKEWELRSDGRLLVTVVINPDNDKKRTYKRVFDRVVPEASEKTDEEAS